MPGGRKSGRKGRSAQGPRADRPPHPPPTPRRLCLVCARHYAGLVFVRMGFVILRIGMSIYERRSSRPAWIFTVGTGFINFGNWIAPRALHESMMRRPANEKDDSR